MSQGIPFYRQTLAPGALDALNRTLEKGALAGNGEETIACQGELAKLIPDSRPFLTTSCTAALEMGVLILNLSPGDEVIMPSWTFASSANAVALRGAIPVFVDVQAGTLNIDVSKVEAAITGRTRAIMCVHYAGVACDMDGLNALSRQYGLVLIEDAAQAIGSTWRNEPLGGLGDLGAFSFHGTKNVSCGEGGALMVNDASLVLAAEVAWEKGTNRLSFLREEVDHYDWCALGSSYLPSEMTAALLAAQLRHAEMFNGHRVRAWDYYRSLLQAPEFSSLTLSAVPPEAGHNGHLFAVRFKSKSSRDAAHAYLLTNGIDVRLHYQPLHLAPAGLKYGRAAGELKVTEAAAETLLRLPIDAVISGPEQDRVVEVLKSALKKYH